MLGNFIIVVLAVLLLGLAFVFAASFGMHAERSMRGRVDDPDEAKKVAAFTLLVAVTCNVGAVIILSLVRI